MFSKTLLRAQLGAAVLLALLLAAVSPSLRAQSAGTSGLSGVVTDPSGAAIPGVTVTITQISTGQTRTTTTGADGAYRFTLLQPGDYRVRFTAAGFKVEEVPSVTLNVTETPELDRTLEVGAQSEQVTVEAAAEALQTQSSTLGTTVNSSTVGALPLSNRNYTQIVGLSAGVNAGVANATAFGKATEDFSVNGSDPGQNNYQMDGVAINNSANSGSSNDSGIYAGIGIPNPDAIQEFKIQTSTYDASYGRNPGANVNVITKSGTNSWHGGAWEFLRNEDFNANDFFDNAVGGGKQQILRQNQFGGDVGGPIKKNKIFIFGNYQGTRQLNGVAEGGASSIFEPLVPAGDRSTPAWQAAMGAANCPANHPGDPRFQTAFAFAGQMQVACDGSNINPVSLGMLNLKLPNGQYYIPTNTGAAFQNIFLSSPAVFHENQLITNMDWVINSKNTFSAKYFYTQDPQTVAFNGPEPLGTPVTNYYANTNAVLKLTSIITNTLVNEARISGQRNNAIGTDTTPGTPQGVGQTPIVPTETELPVTVIAGAFNMFGTLAPDVSPTNQLQVADQISWSHGKHTIRAGFEAEGTRWPISFMGLERGFLFYLSFADWLVGRGGCAPGDATCSPGNPGNTTGSAFSDITACLFCVRSGPTGIIHNYGEHNYSAFVQDDYKVSSHLTLNLGVRWEYDGTYNDKYGNLTNVWPDLMGTVPAPTSPSPTGNGLVGYVVPNNFIAHYGQSAVLSGISVNSNGTPIEDHVPLSNFAPRVGFAYQLNDKLVIRGGAGLFYDRIAGDRFVHGLEQGYPYSITLDYPSAQNTYSNQNPYPTTPLSFPPRWYNTATLTGSNLDQAFLDPVIHTPLVRQYNFNIQYEFAPRWILEVGYVGSSAINLVDTYHDYNIPLLASPSDPINGITTNTTENAGARVPYLGYIPGGLTGTAFDGSSNFNSLQVTVRKQFSHGLTFQASYTWNKDLGDVNGSLTGANEANSNNPMYLNQQYGPLYFNHPQRLIINYAYDLPLGQHQGFLGYLLGGWNISGVTTVQDGTPLTITDSTGGSIYGLTSSRAQMCPGASYGTAKTPGSTVNNLNDYVNFNAFCSADLPQIGDGTGFGNSGVGILLGPGQFNFDASLIKTTKLGERQTLIFRAEAFNLFNHPQFGNPANLAVSTPAAFGAITTSSVNPRILQLALKYYF
ncbi:MAG TPA: carboxypeptidase-like regulatory domain-containing protein [Bryobacteraceae bacterium]|nr:carboxypeptidase-like regulatory domain-containing protein [Bryobacteraceae bacterium]HUO32147.1 carboxypeptidase-like regulatory domain-containing protein [Bryobacteraceae bacterium]